MSAPTQTPSPSDERAVSISQAKGRLRWGGRLSHWSTRWAATIVIALLVIWSTSTHTSRQDVLVTLRTTAFQFTIPASGPDLVKCMYLGGMDLQHASMSGVGSLRAKGREYAAENGEIDLGGSDAAAGAAHTLTCPRGSTVAIRTSDDIVEIEVRAPKGGDATKQAELSLSVPAAWLPERMRGRGLDAEPMAVTVAAAPGQTLSLVLKLSHAGRAVASLGVQGTRTEDFTVTLPRLAEEPPESSELISGTMTFPDLPRREPEAIWIGERIKAHRSEGIILAVDRITTPPDDSAGAWSTSSLRVAWRGTMTLPRIGHPGNERDPSPSILDAWLSTRSFSDLIALVVAILTALALLLSK